MFFILKLPMFTKDSEKKQQLMQTFASDRCGLKVIATQTLWSLLTCLIVLYVCISEQWMLYVWWMFLSHRKFITYLVFTSPQLNLFSLTTITRDLFIVAVELVAQHIQDIIYKRKIASKNGSPFTRSRSNSCGEISR